MGGDDDDDGWIPYNSTVSEQVLNVDEATVSVMAGEGAEGRPGYKSSG